jgi:6-phosphofructokinase 1
MFREEGGDLFDARHASLGHTLQGGIPSPIDRARAVRLAIQSLKFLEDHHQALLPTSRKSLSMRPTASPESAAVVTLQKGAVKFVPVKEMVQHSDMKNRRGKKVWWEGMKEIAEHLAARPQLIDLNPEDFAEYH